MASLGNLAAGHKLGLDVTLSKFGVEEVQAGTPAE